MACLAKRSIASLRARPFATLRVTVPKSEIKNLKSKISKGGTMPELKHFTKMRVAFVTETGPFGDAIQRGYEKLFAWLGAHNIQPRGASLAIFPDDPRRMPIEQVRSECCAPVADEVQGSGDVRVKAIGGAEMAMTEYRGIANIQAAYDEVYAWLRAQGYRDNGAVIEVYLSQPGEEMHAQVYVPIVKAIKRVAKKPVAKKSVKKPVAKKAVKKKAARK
jgi:DNA gyrase inhibitor GyrI